MFFKILIRFRYFALMHKLDVWYKMISWDTLKRSRPFVSTRNAVVKKREFRVFWVDHLDQGCCIQNGFSCRICHLHQKPKLRWPLPLCIIWSVLTVLEIKIVPSFKIRGNISFTWVWAKLNFYARKYTCTNCGLCKGCNFWWFFVQWILSRDQIWTLNKFLMKYRDFNRSYEW